MDPKKAILAHLKISYMMVYAFNQEYIILYSCFNVVMFYANGRYGFQYTVQKYKGKYLRKYSLTLAIS